MSSLFILVQHKVHDLHDRFKMVIAAIAFGKQLAGCRTRQVSRNMEDAVLRYTSPKGTLPGCYHLPYLYTIDLFLLYYHN